MLSNERFWALHHVVWILRCLSITYSKSCCLFFYLNPSLLAPLPCITGLWYLTFSTTLRWDGKVTSPQSSENNLEKGSRFLTLYFWGTPLLVSLPLCPPAFTFPGPRYCSVIACFLAYLQTTLPAILTVPSKWAFSLHFCVSAKYPSWCLNYKPEWMNTWWNSWAAVSSHRIV